MLFPVSGVEVNPFLPFVVAYLVSCVTSMGGVSGAFLLLPFQVSFLGYTSPSVSATNQVFNIVAIPSGVYRYIREGRMLWPLMQAVIIGTLPGVFIGAWLRIEYLPDPVRFKCFAGIILLYIGARLLSDCLKKKHSNPQKPIQSETAPFQLKIVTATYARAVFDFDGDRYDFRPVVVCGICLFVGVVGGIYGIGGGAIVAPVFVAIMGLPVHAVAGAALMGTFITSVTGVIFYQLLALGYPEMSIAPDWWLGSLLGAGGMLGMYTGARLQRFIPAKIIKCMLCICVLFVGIKYIADFILITD